MSELEVQIDQWRGFVRRHQTITEVDVTEMESHLRDQVDDLVASGLSDDEAFLVAVKRMGRLDDISREFAREHSDRLWKQLVLTPSKGDTARAAHDFGAALTCAIGAALAVKAGVEWLDGTVLARNVALFVAPLLAGYFAWKRQPGWRLIAVATSLFVASALIINLYPFKPELVGHMHHVRSTEPLAAIHLPVVLWLIVGLAYVGGQWRSALRRMDFIRFTGEWVVYLALIALGSFALIALTFAAFNAVGVDLEDIMGGWILPCGVAGAAVIAAWLVEAKQSVVENIAPVLTRIFTPLTLVMLVALLSTFAIRRDFADVSRDLLIVMDLILVLVVGLVLYAISARDAALEPGWFDRLQYVLMVVALAADAVLLFTMIARIADAGFTANKVAALGLNLVLLVNLVWSTRLNSRFVRGAIPFAALEKWQTDYLPVYGLWAAFVVVVLPPLFRFA